SHPEENSPSPRSAEIARTLKRFQEKGLTCHYYSCNIADIESVKTLVARIEQELGQITGVIHGAAINRPQRVEQCPLEEAYQEVTPKILGLLNLMGVLENKAPKLIVGFSSIGSVLGLPGNTWYSFSNEALDLILRRFQQEHPKTAVISLAYSIWADVGMGARMNAVESLARRGIEAISVSEGVSRFVELVENDPGDAQVVIAARLGNLDSLKGNFDTWLTKRTAPPTRLTFLEQIEILEPGVESVIRSHLTLKRDSYVQHHIYKG
ncbi:MAG: SDR family NAD(P)-dependent oxidoreductase, partial [Microcystis sp.]